MLNKPRTKLKKHYYRNKGKRKYMKHQKIKRNNYKFSMQILKIFCKGDQTHQAKYLKPVRISINKPLKNSLKRKYIKHGLDF